MKFSIKKLFSKFRIRKNEPADAALPKEAKETLIQLELVFSGGIAKDDKSFKANLPEIKMKYFEIPEFKWRATGNDDYYMHYTLKRMTSSSFLHESRLFCDRKGDLGLVVIKQLENKRFEVIFVSNEFGEVSQRATFSDWDYLFRWLTEITK